MKMVAEDAAESQKFVQTLSKLLMDSVKQNLENEWDFLPSEEKEV